MDASQFEQLMGAFDSVEKLLLSMVCLLGFIIGVLMVKR